MYQQNKMSEQQISENTDTGFKSYLIERYGDLEFVEQSIDDLKCIKCEDVAILFTITPCGLLCKDCKTKIQNRANQKCPKCNAKHTYGLKDDCGQFEKFQSRIDTLIIKCPNHKYECKYEDQLSKMRAHMNICQHLSYNKIKEEVKSEGNRNENKDEMKITDWEIKSGVTPKVNETENPKQLNILLVGPTGSGKSTFVNAFANYVKYDTFEDAVSSDLDVIIPCKFNIGEGKDRKTVEYGSDSNENFQTGQSCTQGCKSYVFQYKTDTICFFDSPGIGDTRGIKQDKINLEKTLDILSQFRHFHAIFIVLKSNETRITPTFEYCIKQLLWQLSKKTLDNVFFVFTHARSTDYHPGDTVEVLNQLFEKIKTAQLYTLKPIANHTIFCLDNEAFRFIASVKYDPNFTSKLQETYAKSWKNAKVKCNTLMNDVISNCSETPGDFKEMLCINQVRKAISDFCKPLAKTAENIEDNLKLLKQHIKDIKKCKNKESDTSLKKLLYTPVLMLKFEEFDAPRTVCQSERCAKTYTVQRLTKARFPQICCDPCNCEGVGQNSGIGDEKIRYCKTFVKKTGLCSRCHCTYRQHKQICYESLVYEGKILEKNTVNDLRKGLNKLADKLIKNLEDKERKLKTEEQMLIKHTAKLIFFFENYAILTCSDAFKRTLEEMIDNGNSSLSKDIIKGLNKMMMNYLKEKELLKKSAAAFPNAESLSINDAQQIIKELFSLEMSKEILMSAVKSDLHEWVLKEKVQIGANANITTKVPPLILISNNFKSFFCPAVKPPSEEWATEGSCSQTLLKWDPKIEANC